MSLKLPRLGLGTAALAGLHQAVDRRTAMETLEAVWSLGIRYFDTAPHYGQGKAERWLGDFLRAQDRDSFFVSTKVGRVLSPSALPRPTLNGFIDPLPFDQRYDYSHEGTMRSFEDSLQRLGLNRIDILLVHDIGMRTHDADHQLHLGHLRDSGFRALEELKRTGAISAFGIGVNEVEICEEILSFQALDLILLAGRYTLLDRSAEPRLLDQCLAAGTQLVIGGVFNSGILATGAGPEARWDYGPAPSDVLRRVEALSDLCAEYGVPLPTSALAFPLRHEAVSTVLLGNCDPARLAENTAAIQGAEIPSDFWKRASEVARDRGTGHDARPR
ncbi:MAG: aldo/keto reductase [Albidovulum sp.]|nr:aldo/keto reductase [Albidovulum sp.]